MNAERESPPFTPPPIRPSPGTSSVATYRHRLAAMPRLDDVASHLDALLQHADTPDYGPALNGLQLANGGEVRGVAAAVDYSMAGVDGAIAAGANLLLLHHGMFWGGAQPIRGVAYDRLARLIAGDIAVYASHLPL